MEEKCRGVPLLSWVNHSTNTTHGTHSWLLLCFPPPPSSSFSKEERSTRGPVLFLDSVSFISFIKWPDARCAVGCNEVHLSDLNRGGENVIYVAYFIK